MCVNVGMWFERFVIIVGTLARMFLPGDWKTYSPSWVEIALFIGTIGMVLALFLLFLRFLPCINIAEVKWTLKESDPHHDDHHDHPDHGTEVVASDAGAAGAYRDIGLAWRRSSIRSNEFLALAREVESLLTP
jgi:molybdopterin-containing oxidoreductase family membrane subunit